MKINEIINEAKKFRRAFHDASPDTETYQQLDNNNSPYLAYRFGIALAGAPDYDMDREGPIGGQFTTVGYSDADRAILDGAKKMMEDLEEDTNVFIKHIGNRFISLKII